MKMLTSSQMLQRFTSKPRGRMNLPRLKMRLCGNVLMITVSFKINHFSEATTFNRTILIRAKSITVGSWHQLLRLLSIKEESRIYS